MRADSHFCNPIINLREYSVDIIDTPQSTGSRVFMFRRVSASSPSTMKCGSPASSREDKQPHSRTSRSPTEPSGYPLPSPISSGGNHRKYRQSITTLVTQDYTCISEVGDNLETSPNQVVTDKWPQHDQPIGDASFEPS